MIGRNNARAAAFIVFPLIPVLFRSVNGRTPILDGHIRSMLPIQTVTPSGGDLWTTDSGLFSVAIGAANTKRNLSIDVNHLLSKD